MIGSLMVRTMYASVIESASSLFGPVFVQTYNRTFLIHIQGRGGVQYEWTSKHQLARTITVEHV